jgi:hypothetical protein
MHELARLVIATSFVISLATPLTAQGGAAPTGQLPPTTPQQTSPPATKLEGFQPTAGSLWTVGYDELGNTSFASGVTVDVRDVRDSNGGGARGLLIEVTESEFRKERSFVDADEIPELIKGTDALLGVKANPTQFKMFEVRYVTRGDLQLTVFNRGNATLHYAIQAGRTLRAQRFLEASDMLKLLAMFEAALHKLTATNPGR